MCLRRNVDLKILLFNNQIYGLTKGQYSPTSEVGKVTKSTPVGLGRFPVQSDHRRAGRQCDFRRRTVDVEQKHLGEMLKRAHAHRGASFVEILQNCNIFNDGAFNDLTDKQIKADHQLLIEHGKPLIFGKNRDKGIRMNGQRAEVVQLGNGVSEKDLIVHDETNLCAGVHAGELRGADADPARGFLCGQSADLRRRDEPATRRGEGQAGGGRSQVAARAWRCLDGEIKSGR